MTNPGWLRLPTALPPLKGTAATAYVFTWLILLTILCVGTAGEVSERLHHGSGDAYTWAPLGLRLEFDSRKPFQIAWVTPAARAAGMRVGDRILAVGGVATNQSQDNVDGMAEVENRLLVPEGHAVVLRTQSAGSTARDVILHHRAAQAVDVLAPSGFTPIMLIYASIATFLLSSLVLLFSSALLFRRRKEPVAALFSLGMIALAATTGNQGAFWANHDLSWLMTACNLLGFSALYATITIFPNGRFQPGWTAALALSFPALLFAGTVIPTVASLVPLWFIAALVAMAMRYRRQAQDERRQWKWAMIGFAVGIAFLLITLPAYTRYLDSNGDDYATALWSWIITPLLIALGCSIIVGGLVLSVVRYRLYDTPVAVSRSLVYAVLTASLVAIFAGSEKILEIVGEEFLGEGSKLVAGGLAAAVAATTIAPLHHRLSHWIEHLLHKDLLHMRAALPPLLLELGDTSDEKTVAEAMLQHLEHGLHAERAAVVTDQKILAARGADIDLVQSWIAGQGQSAAGLALDQHDPLFPVRVPLTSRANRWLLVGPRPDGSLYGKDESETLYALAAPFGQALSAANRNAVQAARIEAIEAELMRLRDQITASRPS